VSLTRPVPGTLSLSQLLLPALGAAVAAGVVVSALQQLFLAPLILQAESFEAVQAAGGAPVPWLQRGAYTLLFNCVAAFGFALLLAAGYALRGGVTWRKGVLWGLCGYVSVALAPALGLPPELPGAPAADLGSRQLWWFMTVGATAAGLAGLFFLRGWAWKLASAVLQLLPHLLGAPRPPVAESAVPQQLAARFAIGSLGISLVLWLLLGTLTAALSEARMRRWAR